MAGPVLGLYAHSRLGRTYAGSRERLGQAQNRSVEHYVNAMAQQESHWAGIQRHIETQSSRVQEG